MRLFMAALVITAARGGSPALGAGATCWLRWADFSFCGFSCRGSQAPATWALALVAHGLSCPGARGIFRDQAPTLCPLRQQAESFPLSEALS